MNLAERRRPHCLVRRRLGDSAEVLLVAQPFERRRRVGVGLGRRIGDRHQPVGEVAPQDFVAFRPRDPRQVADGPEAVDRRTPHADVLVGRRELRNHAPVLGIVGQLRDAGEPDGGIGVAVLGLGS